ncbi:hypothetical protein L207DRAFT_17786 [Hyaloscypha variabilis F]|uniref:Uncharacterized protein n=1 Tax=Hyaloscypha variabilis (strain UAMH 11265 / GT02V1 / F) TaxID=1149755 RepID=A0A2J6SDH6_HYAVF|nr:hypothetical protein L207DRAFT_17786 [Hyaloscypha variabilis F]
MVRRCFPVAKIAGSSPVWVVFFTSFYVLVFSFNVGLKLRMSWGCYLGEPGRCMGRLKKIGVFFLLYLGLCLSDSEMARTSLQAETH